jgi:hypothetical protein
MSVACLTLFAVIGAGTGALAAPHRARGLHEGRHVGPPALKPVLTPAERRLLAADTNTWSDLGDVPWARTAVRYVAGANDFMADYPPNADGSSSFHPMTLENRIRFARALVKAFAPTDVVDPALTFPDISADSPAYRYANVAVTRGWMPAGAGGTFRPSDPITMIDLHRALVLALGLGPAADALDHLRTSDGHAFVTPANFGTTLLGMRLGLRHNSWIESLDVLPATLMDRAQVAYSLFRALTEPPHAADHLAAEYGAIELPPLSPQMIDVVQWGIRYVGYPYIWAGEWGKSTPEPGALGGQPIAGFDCSGFVWWLLRTNQPSIGWRVAPPRPYAGWPLAQRWSFDMATVGHVPWSKLRPGDLAFYHEGRGVHHVDTYIGNGWALDSSAGPGGVTIMWIGTGWYANHFVHGRHVAG